MAEPGDRARRDGGDRGGQLRPRAGPVVRVHRGLEDPAVGHRGRAPPGGPDLAAVPDGGRGPRGRLGCADGPGLGPAGRGERVGAVPVVERAGRDGGRRAARELATG